MTLRHTLPAATAVVLMFLGVGCTADEPGGDASAGVGSAADRGAPSPSSTVAPAQPSTTGSDRPLARTRVIEVEMDEFTFRPERLEVEAGETVEFRFVNTGAEVHDAFVGTTKEQQEHAAEMAHDDSGHAHHTSNDAVTVEPGGTATITKAFDALAVLEIGCHQPGHYQSGMRLALTVT